MVFLKRVTTEEYQLDQRERDRWWKMNYSTTMGICKSELNVTGGKADPDLQPQAKKKKKKKVQRKKRF